MIKDSHIIYLSQKAFHKYNLSLWKALVMMKVDSKNALAVGESQM